MMATQFKRFIDLGKTLKLTLNIQAILNILSLCYSSRFVRIMQHMKNTAIITELIVAIFQIFLLLLLLLLSLLHTLSTHFNLHANGLSPMETIIHHC